MLRWARNCMPNNALSFLICFCEGILSQEQKGDQDRCFYLPTQGASHTQKSIEKSEINT